jgi:transcriptional regulator with XRE-family HTH domain
METIGDRIKRAREYFNETQEGFAKWLFMRPSVLSKVEDNKKEPSARMLSYLSSYYRVKENWLMVGEGEMFPKEFELAYKLVGKYCVENNLNLQGCDIARLAIWMNKSIWETPTWRLEWLKR